MAYHAVLAHDPKDEHSERSWASQASDLGNSRAPDHLYASGRYHVGEAGEDD